MANTILLPAIAMVALTCAVWCRMYVVRIRQMFRDRIHPQSVATSSQAMAKFTDSAPADNFRNLFELPVLFYLALTTMALRGQSGTLELALAWLFVALRVVHSAIHCSYNRVLHRFAVYVAGAVVLWILWAVIAVRALNV